MWPGVGIEQLEDKVPLHPDLYAKPNQKTPFTFRIAYLFFASRIIYLTGNFSVRSRHQIGAYERLLRGFYGYDRAKNIH